MFLTQSRLGMIDIMIEICERTLLKPLIITFQNSVKYSYYPDIWKRSNIIPVHKKVINN